MLQLAVVCPGVALAEQLFRLLPMAEDVEFTAVLRKYPSSDELLEMIRSRGAQALLLSADNLDTAFGLASAIDRHLPGFPVMTASDSKDGHMLAKFMQAGVRDHLVSPIEAGDLAAALNSARRRAKPVSPAVVQAAASKSELVTFLPARAGVGSTTIATAVACVSAQSNVRTLLMDCDLSAGVVQFLLQANRGASVPDVLEHAAQLDVRFFGEMVGRWKQLELLNAGTLDARQALNLAGVETVLQVAQDRYEVTCVDLPSSVDGLSEMLLRASSKIFLVTTSEVVNLHMTSVRIRQLSERGLRDRIRLVLNRKMSRKKMGEQEVEQTLGMPVSFTLANDYASVQTAILEASPLAMKGELANGVQAIATSLATGHQKKEEAPKRKFLEYFNLSEARYLS